MTPSPAVSIVEVAKPPTTEDFEMQGGEQLVATINAMVAQSMAAAVADLVARLEGYETAIVAITNALDKTGALPNALAKSAIDAAAATVDEKAVNAPIRDVLQRISQRLSAPAATRH